MGHLGPCTGGFAFPPTILSWWTWGWVVGSNADIVYQDHLVMVHQTPVKKARRSVLATARAEIRCGVDSESFLPPDTLPLDVEHHAVVWTHALVSIVDDEPRRALDATVRCRAELGMLIACDAVAVGNCKRLLTLEVRRQVGSGAAWLLDAFPVFMVFAVVARQTFDTACCIFAERTIWWTVGAWASVLVEIVLVGTGETC